MRDLAHAVRALLRQRSTAAVAILCLSLGIGANTALFGTLDALLFRSPSGVDASDQLVRVNVGPPASARKSAPAVTYPTYLNARERVEPIAGLAAYSPRRVTLDGGERAELLDAVIGTENYFSVLRVRPAAGRFFSAADDGLAVAILSFSAWHRMFGGTRDAIGSVINVNGIPVSVIGVAPRDFVGLDLGDPDVWLPIWLARLDAFGGPRQHSDRVFWLQMFARRTDGQAAGPFALSLGERHGTQPPGQDDGMALHAAPLRPLFFAEQAGSTPIPLWSMGITALVLLLACATVANMLLAQGAAREREIAVRLALGAPRSSVVRQLMLEALLIALAAAVCALAIAEWGRRILTVLPIPSISHLVNVRVTAFALLVAVFTTLLFGLLPSLWAARGSLEAALRRTSGGGREGRPQLALMVTQIALSFMLLVGAGLFVASFRQARSADVGFDLDRVLTASFELGTLPAADAASLLERATPRIRSLPGVEAVGRGRIQPYFFFSRARFTIPDSRPGGEQSTSVLVNAVDPDYFTSLGIGIASGRQLTDQDRANTEPVAVVSQSLAGQYWHGESPIGACIRLPDSNATCVRVVGVAQDVRFEQLQGAPSEVLYVAAAQRLADPPATLFVRTTTSASVAGAVRRSIQELDPTVPFVRVEPLNAWARPQRLPWEVAATLFSLFGALATLLAAVGLYMLVSFVVSQRKRELAIRMAMGATSMDIGWLVIARSLHVTAAGIAIGGLGALLLGRILANRLYGASSYDISSYISAAAVLAMVTLLASWLPARAAGQVEPYRTLREE